jgi:hypothetical protein
MPKPPFAAAVEDCTTAASPLTSMPKYGFPAAAEDRNVAASPCTNRHQNLLLPSPHGV